MPEKSIKEAILGVKEVDWFESYVGLPTLDMVWKKLQGWKGMLLSRAGKEVLIKVVTQSIPTYTMGVFQLPMKLYDELDALLATPKKEGGMGFCDLGAFNLEDESLLYKCFKARYFPRSNFLEAVESPNCSFVWRSIMAACPILKNGCCWRVGNGSSIRVHEDRWILNYPTNTILYPANEETEGLLVANLIDPDLHWWRRELIMSIFHTEDAEAILKLAYKVAVLIQRGDEWTEKLGGCVGKNVWTALWKLQIPSKIKVFGFLESTILALWNCEVAKDVWARSLVKLRKCSHGQADMLELIEYLLSWLSLQEMEVFLVQAWHIWNQRNKLLHGVDYLEEYRASQNHLRVDDVVPSVGEVWKPPLSLVFKLNFDAPIFVENQRIGFSAIIRNDKGEVMAAMTVVGPPMSNSKEAELLACKKVVEFATNVGFSEIVNEGDNMDDVHHLVLGLLWVNFSCIRRGGNRVAHALAQHARNIFEDVFWMEDSPPPTMNALYQDSLMI
ncbi:hypothetical protein ACB092_07G081300 [Castanea dentata]